MAATIAAEVAAQRATLTQDIVSRISFDIVAAAPPGMAPPPERIAANVDRQISLILMSVSTGRSLTSTQLDSLAPLGMGDGSMVPGHVLLKAHRLICDAAWEALRRTARTVAPSDPALLRTISSSIQVISAQLVAEVTRRHSERIRELSKRPDNRRHSYLSRLLVDDGVPPRGAVAPGISRDALHAVAVATVDPRVERDISLYRLLEEASSSVTRTMPSIQRTDVGLALVVSIPGSNDAGEHIGRQLCDALGSTDPDKRAGLSVGVGRALRGLSGITASYRQALRALEIAMMQPSDPNILTYDQAMPSLLLTANPSLMSDFAAILDPVATADRDRSTLMDTVAALARSGGRATTASAELHIHRHTLAKRVQRIERLTGRRIDDPEDMLVLSLAVLARTMTA